MEEKSFKKHLKNMTEDERIQYNKENCIFCKIIDNKVPSKSVYSDDHVLAVLDLYPANKGHVIVMPKKHYTILPQMPDDEAAYLFKIVKKISNVLLKTFNSEGTSIFVANGFAAGQKSNHILVHIIPRFKNDDLENLNIDSKELSKEEYDKIYSKLVGKDETL